MGYNNSARGKFRSRKDNDGKYVRLTGLWQSKKNDSLWTGKMRNQDLERLLEKVEEADKSGADLVVFLWENRDKEGQKDPDFTVQVSVSEDDGNSRRGGFRSSRAGSDRGKDRADEDQDDNDNSEEADAEPEEKPVRRGKRTEKEEPRSRRAGSSKKDKSDW